MKLLAKSKYNGREVTILDHALQVEEVANLIFNKDCRMKKSWLRFFNILKNQEDMFIKTLRVISLLHDIGKANCDFQMAVTKPGSITQSLRHEHISTLILSMPECKTWLKESGIDYDIVRASILSHHIKASLIGNYELCVSKNKSKVEIYLNSSDISNIFSKVSEILCVETSPVFMDVCVWEQNNNKWMDILESIKKESQEFRRKLRYEKDKQNLLLALKAGLVVCDSIASGTVRENKSIIDWIGENVYTPSVTQAELQDAILLPRAKEIEKRTNKQFQLHNFQKLAGEVSDRALLIAPCGAGKTLAAWQWAQQRSLTNNFGRVIFLYPTRGTATEGYKDYVGWAPEGTSTLLHSSSKYELELMMENPAESLKDKDISKLESEERMFALGLWKFRFFSSTVDQFLSFMQNNYKSLCLLPVLSDSVIILDEIHSYDKTMLDMLLTFLKQFNVPVLCMTATLLPTKLNKLLATGLEKFPREEQLCEIKDLVEISNHPRYNISYCQKESSYAIQQGIDDYKKGKKVLIVVNRVKRCLEVAYQIQQAIGEFPLVYHSRFKLADRYHQHNDVVTAFKQSNATIAVTTQVCEMSLDLDADTLITELAPVSSMIQRFGRANRHLKNKDILGNIIIYAPSKVKPYSEKELKPVYENIKEFLGIKSQTDLANILDTNKFDIKVPNTTEDGQFIRGGYFAVSSSFREEDYFGCVPAILDCDLNKVLLCLKNKKSIDGFIVPAPRSKIRSGESKLPNYIGIISEEYYKYTIDERLGLIV
jgi:CRISPR-associated endonuclease/helicase Cas3